MFYLIHYIQNDVILMYNQYKNLMRLFPFFSYQVFEINVHFAFITQPNLESHFCSVQ